MSAEHEMYEGWAAAYVLSALEPNEKAAFEQHQKTCAECQAEIQYFAAVPALLAQVDLDEVDTTGLERVTASAVDGARRELASLERRERRWRNTALTAIAAGLLLVAGIGVTAWSSNGRASQTEVAFESQAEGAVLIGDRSWGTRIELDLAGLEPRPEYELWTVDSSGAWESVVVWPSPPEGLARITGESPLDPNRIERLVITSVDNKDDVVLNAEL